MDTDFSIFYHIAGIGRWHSIVIEQTDILITSGLYDNAKKIFFCFCGSESDIKSLREITDQHKKISVVHLEKNFQKYEYPTLVFIQNYIKSHEDNILYFHVKGASYLNAEDCVATDNWRKYMNFFVLEKWRYCLKKLKSHDTVGVSELQKENKFLFYCGNYWWSTAKYLRSCDSILNFDFENRWEAERWLSTGIDQKSFNWESKYWTIDCFKNMDEDKLAWENRFKDYLRQHVIGLYKKNIDHKISVFYHIAGMGRWRTIILEQLHILVSSGLYEEADKIFFCFCGGDEKLHLLNMIMETYPKITLMHLRKDASEYEYPTLDLIQNYVKVHDDHILYFHTKGASYEGNDAFQKGADKWRQYMNFFVITRWRETMAQLETHDCSGVWEFASEGKFIFYCGNFWWAKAKYLRTCFDILQCDRANRYNAEFWIGSGHQANVFNWESLYNTEQLQVTNDDEEEWERRLLDRLNAI